MFLSHDRKIKVPSYSNKDHTWTFLVPEIIKDHYSIEVGAMKNAQRHRRQLLCREGRANTTVN
jgi:hypothetical protein